MPTDTECSFLLEDGQALDALSQRVKVSLDTFYKTKTAIQDQRIMIDYDTLIQLIQKFRLTRKLALVR